MKWWCVRPRTVGTYRCLHHVWCGRWDTRQLPGHVYRKRYPVTKWTFWINQIWPLVVFNQRRVPCRWHTVRQVHRILQHLWILFVGALGAYTATINLFIPVPCTCTFNNPWKHFLAWASIVRDRILMFPIVVTPVLTLSMPSTPSDSGHGGTPAKQIDTGLKHSKETVQDIQCVRDCAIGTYGNRVTSVASYGVLHICQTVRNRFWRLVRCCTPYGSSACYLGHVASYPSLRTENPFKNNLDGRRRLSWTNNGLVCLARWFFKFYGFGRTGGSVDMALVLLFSR
jgi:hypothetical protein